MRADHLLGRWAGSHWFMGGVAIALAALFSLWLAAALLEAQEMAERMVVESTIRNMRTGLLIARSEAMIAGRESEIAGWAGANPVRWLGGPPTGYVGDCPCPASDVAEGAWCFDAGSRQLVYRPRHARHLHLTGSEGEKILRWRAASRDPATNGGFFAASVELLTPYRWQLE